MQLSKADVPLINLPVSINQETTLLYRELLRLQKIDPPFNHMSLGIALSGPLNFGFLENVLNELLRRNPSLRSFIVPSPTLSSPERDARLAIFANTGLFESGTYVFSAVENVSLNILRADWAALDDETQKMSLRLLLRHEKVRPFDYSAPPLLRAYLIRKNIDEHLLVLLLDHCVSDGWSMNVLFNEIKHGYRAVAEGHPMSPVPLSYSDFTLWQNEVLKGDYFKAAVAYWRRQWATFGSDRIGYRHLPFVISPPTRGHMTYDLFEIAINIEESNKIRAFLGRHRVTLYIVFLSVLAIVLKQYTGKNKLAIWSHFANRLQPDLARTIGFLANTHLVTFLCDPDITCLEFVTQVQLMLREALAHQQMPLQHLWRTLQCHPRFGDLSILLDVYEAPSSSVETSGGVVFRHTVLPEPNLPRLSHLGVYVTDSHSAIAIKCRYSQALFDKHGIVELVEALRTTALSIVTDPAQLISDCVFINTFRATIPALPQEMDEFIVVGSKLVPPFAT